MQIEAVYELMRTLYTTLIHAGIKKSVRIINFAIKIVGVYYAVPV